MIETIVQVDGMMCGMCESHINDAIRSHFQVKKVSSSHTKGQTVIQSQEPLDREQLAELQQATEGWMAIRPGRWYPVLWKSGACWAA